MNKNDDANRAITKLRKHERHAFWHMIVFGVLFAAALVNLIVSLCQEWAA